MNIETKLRMEIVEAGKRLHQRFFVASNDGNISAKLTDDTILITPTRVNKGDLTSDQIIKVDLEGNVIEGHMKTTSEIKMHLAVYRLRKDVTAVVHAHPPAATAFAVAGEKIDDPVTLPEAVIGLGEIGYCKYGTPSTDEVHLSIEDEIIEKDVLLLANHGALAVGNSVLDAYYRIETLEMVSRINLGTKIIGKVNALTDQQVNELNDIKAKIKNEIK